ncbi:hypothetical protein GQ55_1G089400 [Panicum hallii var. hallii]|uniref:Tryptophan synthase beta chain-like PALP domain-containing protein n=1 Tax=Panicum hallii var. hallii TaxID=1504633 RepID=A0A2T7F3S2_9POAL|nr:hypothetical protein GQ55_1G089400 [Panicum hallii var. hallii]
MEMQEGRKGIPSLLSSQGSALHPTSHSWTPLIEMKNIAKKDGINARLVGKIELLIEDAEEKSLISPGITTLVAVTSGNLGIGVAFVAVQKGYKFTAVMPAKIAIDKKILLRYLGVEVILVDSAINGFKGLLDRVEQLKNEIRILMHISDGLHGVVPTLSWSQGRADFYMNTRFHERPEIWKDTEGKVDIFVAAFGSGGTLTGTGRYLKMKNPSVKLICVEPAESAVISGGEPAYHKIQGTGPGFVPEILDTSQIDEIVTVTDQEAMDMARRGKCSRLLKGMLFTHLICASSVVAAREENEGKMIVLMFSSGGERYLNSELFAQVKEECVNMNMAF